MTTKALRVLVFGDDTRSFLAVVRSLGRTGAVVIAAPYDFASPALSSSYISKIAQIPPYSISQDQWVTAVTSAVRDNEIDLIVACDDRGILPLHRHREKFKSVQLAIPNKQVIEYFYDKHKTRELASRCGVYVAAGRLLQESDTAEKLIAEFDLPLAIKPRRSFDIDNIAQRKSVVLCHAENDLDNILQSITDRSAYIVEAFLPDGQGLGISVLAKDGTISQAFQYLRAREMRRGGGSSYRYSTTISKELLSAVQRMAKEVKLDGVAMFEFRKSARDGRIILLEVNARFWGGLPLAIFCGVDFPALYIKQLQGKTLTSQIGYRPSVYARSLVADLYCINEELKHAKEESTIRMISQLFKISCELGRFFLLRDSIDTFDTHDLKPFLEEGRAILREISAKVRYTSPGLRKRKILEFRKAYMEALEKKNRKDPVNFLFVCFGNICRSPYAAVRAQSYSRKNLEFSSAGTLPIEGRTSPHFAIDAAGDNELDLSGSRSQYASLELLNRQDFIVVFDQKNKDSVRSLGFTEMDKVIYLSWFLPENQFNKDITDPYGKSLQEFKHTYSLINKSLDKLIRITDKAF